MHHRFLLSGLVTTLLLTTAAMAQVPTQPAEKVAEKPGLPFDKGAQSFSLTSGHYVERTGEQIYLTNVTAEYASYVADGVALAVQGVGYYGYEEEPALGAGISVVARWHFLRSGRVSIYADILGGVMQLDENFPEGGTHFNFTYQAGPGMTVQLADQLHLVGGIRFAHVSNGFIEGRDRNPVFNSYGGYMGLMWTF